MWRLKVKYKRDALVCPEVWDGATKATEASTRGLPNPIRFVDSQSRESERERQKKERERERESNPTLAQRSRSLIIWEHICIASDSSVDTNQFKR